jgi:hypothetical protein
LSSCSSNFFISSSNIFSALSSPGDPGFKTTGSSDGSWISNRTILLFSRHYYMYCKLSTGSTKGGSITVLLTSCLTGLESAVWQQTIFDFICDPNQSNRSTTVKWYIPL